MKQKRFCVNVLKTLLKAIPASEFIIGSIFRQPERTKAVLEGIWDELAKPEVLRSVNSLSGKSTISYFIQVKYPPKDSCHILYPSISSLAICKVHHVDYLASPLMASNRIPTTSADGE